MPEEMRRTRRDDIVFYCMNAYWEPLVMQLPVLPNGKHWHVDTNTNAEYF